MLDKSGDHLIDRERHIEHDRIGRFFERVELAFEQGGIHEVTFAGHEAGLNEIEGALEIDEAKLWQSLREAFAVDLAKGGAGEEERFALSGGLAEFFVEEIEPRPTVGIGEGNTGGHFRFTGFGMIEIGVHPDTPGGFSQFLGHGAFAAPRNAHDNIQRHVFQCTAEGHKDST